MCLELDSLDILKFTPFNVSGAGYRDGGSFRSFRPSTNNRPTSVQPVQPPSGDHRISARIKNMFSGKKR